MAQSAFTSTESTSSSASTVAPVPPYEQGRRLHIVLDLDHTLVNANEGQQRHHPPDAHARPLHSFVMYNTENGTNPRYLLGLRDGLHDFLQELERLATVPSIDSPALSLTLSVAQALALALALILALAVALAVALSLALSLALTRCAMLGVVSPV